MSRSDSERRAAAPEVILSLSNAARCALVATLVPALLAAAPKEVGRRDGAHAQSPQFSGDGAKLTWEANDHEKKVVELYVGDWRTGGFQRVAPIARSASSMTSGFSATTKGGQVVHELSWAPPAINRFVYVATNDLQDYDLYLGGGGALAPGMGADGGPAWSPDGRYIAFTSARTGQGDVYLLDTQAIDAPPKRLTTDPDASELMLTWKPGGKSLVFVGHSDRGDNLWWLADIAAPVSVKLVDWAHSQVRPTFSPLGDKVAFYANKDDPERWDLYVVEPKVGGVPVKLANDVVLDVHGPSFTPDGKHLVVVLDDDKRYDPIVAIPLANPAAPKVLELGTVGHGDLDVAKTPDGKVWLAYAAQGTTAGAVRTFDKLYVVEMPPLP